MAIRSNSSLCRAASALAFLLVLAACTPGGQFDPTEVFNSDMFDSKTKLKGQREPLFPNGVPGTTTGVPADLVKGYQPPPDQTDADASAIGAPPPAGRPARKPWQNRSPNRKLRSDGRERGQPRSRSRHRRRRRGSTSVRRALRRNSLPMRFGRIRRRLRNKADKSRGRRRRRAHRPSRPHSRRNRSGRHRRPPHRRSPPRRRQPHQIRNRGSHSIRCGPSLRRAARPPNSPKLGAQAPAAGGTPIMCK